MKRQTKILLCLLSILLGAGLLAVILFRVGGNFHHPPEEEFPSKDKDSSGGGYSLPPEVLVDREIFSGYWWSDENSFFCIEEGKYRLYRLNAEKSVFVLSKEYTVSVVGKYLFLYPENRDETPLGEVSVYTACEKPALPIRADEGSR